jgi:hypothetical protein
MMIAQTSVPVNPQLAAPSLNADDLVCPQRPDRAWRRLVLRQGFGVDLIFEASCERLVWTSNGANERSGCR